MTCSSVDTLRFVALKVLVLLFVSGLAVQGALLSGSDPRFGPGSLTIDTSTGLAWLNLPASAGYSYDQMTAALQPGGAFAGFRYATAQEVAGLFGSAGIPGIGWIPESSPAFQPVIALINLVRPTSNQDGNPEAGGISGTWGQTGLIRPMLDFEYQAGVPGYMVSGYPTPVWEFGETTAGSSWLVAAIPEPGVGGMAALGAFLSMFGWRVCRK
jgi:hypothetical protein